MQNVNTLAATPKVPEKGVSVAVRNQQIERFFPLVEKVLRRVARNFPAHADMDNLRSAGVAGLVESASRFDPTKEETFAAYAGIRIHGAILDAVRELDATPRRARMLAKRILIARATVESELGREATPDEVARELNVTLEQFCELEDRARVIRVFSIDRDTAPCDDSKTPSSFHDLLEDPTERVSTKMERVEALELMTRLLAELPAQQRKVMALIYREGLTLAEVGEAMGYTESRICQIRQEVIAILRREMSREKHQ